MNCIARIIVALVAGAAALFGLFRVYELYEHDHHGWTAVEAAFVVLAPLVVIIAQNELEIRLGVDRAAEESKRTREQLEELLRRGRSSRVRLVESYDDFARSITELIEKSETQVLVSRIHNSSASPLLEQRYFDVTKAKLKSHDIPKYRRICNVRAPAARQSAKNLLAELGAIEEFEMSVWNSPIPLLNFDLVIIDFTAIMAFHSTEGGPPDKGIVTTDDRIVKHLVELHEALWKDQRNVVIKSVGALTAEQIQDAARKIPRYK